MVFLNECQPNRAEELSTGEEPRDGFGCQLSAVRADDGVYVAYIAQLLFAGIRLKPNNHSHSRVNIINFCS